jgi:hypothetical protein
LGSTPAEGVQDEESEAWRTGDIRIFFPFRRSVYNTVSVGPKETMARKATIKIEGGEQLF